MHHKVRVVLPQSRLQPRNAKSLFSIANMIYYIRYLDLFLFEHLRDKLKLTIAKTL